MKPKLITPVLIATLSVILTLVMGSLSQSRSSPSSMNLDDAALAQIVGTEPECGGGGGEPVHTCFKNLNCDAAHGSTTDRCQDLSPSFCSGDEVVQDCIESQTLAEACSTSPGNGPACTSTGIGHFCTHYQFYNCGLFNGSCGRQGALQGQSCGQKCL